MINLLLFIVSTSTLVNVNGYKALWIGAYSNDQISYEKISGYLDIQVKGPFYIRHLPLWRVEVQGNGTASIEYPDPFYVTPFKYYSSEFANLYQKLTINTVVIQPSSYPSREGTGAEILIITPNGQFVEKLTPLVEWKMQRGKSVYIATTDETGTSFYSIRNYISNAYFSWDIPPEYIILVGNENLVPTYVVYDSLGCQGYFAIDNPYVRLEGIDFLADAFIGRLSVSNAQELTNLITKILTYEKHPDSAEPSWLDRSTFFTDAEYQPETLYIPPKESIRVFLMDSLDFVHVDTFYLHEDWWQYSSEDLINAVEEGRGFLNYRGNAGGILLPPWNDFRPEVTHNANRTPIGVLVSCGLADFLMEPSESEKWIRTYDTLDQTGGFVAFVGTSGCVYGEPFDPNFHTVRRNALDIGFFLGLNDMPTPSLGYLLESGRIRMLNQYPVPEFWAQYHYEEFLILGDPEMHPWKTSPRTVDVEYPSQSPPGTFTVNVSRNGTPISDAYVGLYHDSTLFMSDTTDINGSASFQVDFYGIATVTVTGNGIYPYQNIAFFGPPDQSNIYLLEANIIDSILGNRNGTVNPGETLNVYIKLANSGGTTADSVWLGIQPLSQNVILIDSSVLITQVSPGEILSNYDLSFRLNPQVQDGESVILLLTIYNGYQVVNDTLEALAHPLDIALNNYEFVSESAPLDSIPMPGEQGDFYIQIYNREPIEFESITLKLKIPQTNVIDSISQIGPVPPDTLLWSLSNPFTIAVPPQIEPGTTLPCTLQVFFNNGARKSLPFVIMVGKVDYLIIPYADSSGSPQEIDSILTQLGYNGEVIPEWSDFIYLFRNPASVYLIAGQSPHHRDLVEGPFVDALWSTLAKGKLLYIEGNRIFYQRDSIRFLQAIPLRYEDVTNALSIDSLYTTTWSPAPDLWFFYDNTGIQEITKVLSNGNGTLISLMGIARLESGAIAPQPAAYTVILDTVKAYVTTVEFSRLIEGEPGWKTVLLDSIMNTFGIIPRVSEFSQNNQILLKILPNPTRNYFIIQSPEDFTLKVFDITGRLVTEKFYHINSTSRKRIQLTLPSGVYFLKISTTSGNYLNRKLVLLR